MRGGGRNPAFAHLPFPSSILRDLRRTTPLRIADRPQPRTQEGGRRPPVSQARADLAYLWGAVLARSGRALAQALGIQPTSVNRAARRGGAHREVWDRLLPGAVGSSEGE